MPAYFSVDIYFKSNIIYPNFVRDVYSIFFTYGFDFKSGFWYGENNSLEEIVEWNQRLLEKGFKLGLSQHVKHDYKQILLNTELFEEMRLFWMFSRKEIQLSLIVPEHDILEDDENYAFIQNKMNPIVDLSCNLWNTGLINAIQSCLELDDGISLKAIERGNIPCINPFCIIEENLFNKFSSKLHSNIEVKDIGLNGKLIVDESLIKSNIK